MRGAARELPTYALVVLGLWLFWRSGKPASMLLHFSPGAPREGYFEGLTRVAQMSEAERAAFYTEHDNIWLS